MADSKNSTDLQPAPWAVRWEDARKEFLLAWRDAVTRMTLSVAEAEAAAMYGTMLNAARNIIHTDPGVSELARMLAWVDRSNHDVSEDSADLWDHLVEDNRERYRAMARHAIVWVEDCHGR